MARDLDKIFDQATEDEKIAFLGKLMARDQLTEEQALAILESREQATEPADQSGLTVGQKLKAGAKKVFSWLGQALVRLLFILFKLLCWLLMAPFFLLSFLKNWFFMGLGLWLFCYFADGVYRVVVLNQYWTSQGGVPTSMNDQITTIIVVIAGALSLIGTTWQYQGKID